MSEHKAIEIIELTEKDFEIKKENFEPIFLQRADSERRNGCDVCGGYSTEKFVGYCGSVLWLCHMCYEELAKGNVGYLMEQKDKYRKINQVRV